ncbi:MAG: hypothetical protein ACOCRO_11530 [Halanaerobiales bacterium]
MSEVIEKLNFEQYIEDDIKTRELICESIDWDYFCNLGYETEMIQLYLGYVQDGTYSDDFIQDGIYEIGDSFVSVYTTELFENYSNSLNLLGWLEEAKANGLLEGTDDVVQMLKAGQYEYNTYILNRVASNLKLI